jgi:hypothetical protein
MPVESETRFHMANLPNSTTSEAKNAKKPGGRHFNDPGHCAGAVYFEMYS